MWIAEFARRAGLKTSTVRHYVREGLLAPRTASAGGSRPYLEFSEADLRLLSAIRSGQALGMSLADIRLLVDERRAGRGRGRMLTTLRRQRDRLLAQAAGLQAMLAFLDRKIEWLEGGARGPVPGHDVSPAPGGSGRPAGPAGA